MLLKHVRIIPAAASLMERRVVVEEGGDILSGVQKNSHRALISKTRSNVKRRCLVGPSHVPASHRGSSPWKGGPRHAVRARKDRVGGRWRKRVRNAP